MSRGHFFWMDDETQQETNASSTRSSVTIHPDVSESWEQIKKDIHPSIDWFLAGFNRDHDNHSLNDNIPLTLLRKGNGGIECCSSLLPAKQAVFGVVKLRSIGQLVHFFYMEEETPITLKERMLYFKKEILCFFHESAFEIQIERGIKEEKVIDSLQLQMKTPNHQRRIAIDDLLQREHHLLNNDGDDDNQEELIQQLHHRILEPPTIRRLANIEYPQFIDRRSRFLHGAHKILSYLMDLQPDHNTKRMEKVTSFPELGRTCKQRRASYPTTTYTHHSSFQPSSALRCVSYQSLKSAIDFHQLPLHVDPRKKEQYLSNDEFLKIFRMTKESFGLLPDWKKKELKIKHFLF